MNEKYFLSGRKFGKTYMASEWVKRQIEQMAQPSDKPPHEPVFRREYLAEWVPTEVNLKVNLYRLDKRKKRRLKRHGQWELFQALRNEYALPEGIKRLFKNESK